MYCCRDDIGMIVVEKHTMHHRCVLLDILSTMAVHHCSCCRRANAERVVHYTAVHQEEAFEVVKLSPTTAKISKDWIQNPKSIGSGTLAPSAKNPVHNCEYTPNVPVDEWDDNVHAGKAQLTAEESTEVQSECAVGRILHYVGEGDTAN